MDAECREHFADMTPEILAELRRLSGEGLYTILNETVDVQDGGVSGVAFGDALEFAPGDTPRCVEKPETAGLPRDLGVRLLETVYGFRPNLPAKTVQRVEFSLHPIRRGYRGEHTILWEVEEPGPGEECRRTECGSRFRIRCSRASTRRSLPMQIAVAPEATRTRVARSDGVIVVAPEGCADAPS